MRNLLTGRRCLSAVLLYVIFALVILVMAPLFGAESVSMSAVLSDLTTDGQWSTDTIILVNLRLNRVLLGFLVGGTLAAVGSVFQVILRNPLATPYTLGVTGGGSLGAALAMFIPGLQVAWGPFSSVQVLALAGSGLTLTLIYLIARRSVGLSVHTILLAGVTVGILCGAIILLIRYLAAPNLLVQIDRWMMGGLAVAGYREIVAVLPLLLPGLALLALQMAALNHMALGEDMALGHGVDVASVQKLSLVGSGLATAAVVSVAGPVGFVGLLVLHAVRRLSGYDHRVVLPGCFLAGGGLLVLCDTVARTIIAPTEIPVGIITAVVGGPFFIYLLLRKT